MDFDSLSRIGLNFSDLDLLQISWDELDQMSPARLSALLQIRLCEIEQSKVLSEPEISKTQKLKKALSAITGSTALSAVYDLFKETVKFILSYIQ